MDLSVVFLGTGGAVPSARRNTAGVLVARGGERLLFDCGEGTQRQMQRSLGLVQVDAIFFTHFHADHFLGLPGLLKTYDLTELNADDAIPLEGAEIRSFPVEHSVRACGYALVEAERPGRFDPVAAEAAGVREGPAFAALQRGETVTGGGGEEVTPGQVMGPMRPGRTLVVTGDTAPCHATVEAAEGADLLVHDASFAEEEAQRAVDTGHSTVGQAAAVAREAEVKLLALVHISSRYHVGTILDEAKEVFEPTIAPRDFDLIELPFPERGEPQLIQNGARERDEPGGGSTAPREAGTAE
jgi:ribonuclease Z